MFYTTFACDSLRVMLLSTSFSEGSQEKKRAQQGEKWLFCGTVFQTCCTEAASTNVPLKMCKYCSSNKLAEIGLVPNCIFFQKTRCCLQCSNCSVSSLKLSNNLATQRKLFCKASVLGRFDHLVELLRVSRDPRGRSKAEQPFVAFSPEKGP